jgi:hypothetical protein
VIALRRLRWPDESSGVAVTRRVVYDGPGPLSNTFPDPDHSFEEYRFIITGSTESSKILLWRTRMMESYCVSSAPERQSLKKESLMKRVESEEDDNLRPEYGFLKCRVVYAANTSSATAKELT